AIELDPKAYPAYNARGVIYEEKGDVERAIADATKAIELNPNYAPAYSNRGNALMRKGDLDSAIAEYTRSIEIDPVQNNGAHLNAYYNRGFAYQLQRDLDRALLPTTPRPSTSIRSTRWLTSAAASSFASGATTTAPSPTSRGRSRSIPPTRCPISG